MRSTDFRRPFFLKKWIIISTNGALEESARVSAAKLIIVVNLKFPP